MLQLTYCFEDIQENVTSYGNHNEVCNCKIHNPFLHLNRLTVNWNLSKISWVVTHHLNEYLQFKKSDHALLKVTVPWLGKKWGTSTLLSLPKWPWETEKVVLCVFQTRACRRPPSSQASPSQIQYSCVKTEPKPLW